MDWKEPFSQKEVHGIAEPCTLWLLCVLLLLEQYGSRSSALTPDTMSRATFCARWLYLVFSEISGEEFKLLQIVL